MARIVLGVTTKHTSLAFQVPNLGNALSTDLATHPHPPSLVQRLSSSLRAHAWLLCGREVPFALKLLSTSPKSHKGDKKDRMQLYAQGIQRHNSFPHSRTSLGGEFSYG